MFMYTRGGWELEGAKRVTMECPTCGNTTDHVAWVHPGGLQVGFLLSKKCMSTNKQYFLACPTCKKLSVELTKEQALSLRG